MPQEKLAAEIAIADIHQKISNVWLALLLLIIAVVVYQISPQDILLNVFHASMDFIPPNTDNSAFLANKLLKIVLVVQIRMAIQYALNVVLEKF